MWTCSILPIDMMLPISLTFIVISHFEWPGIAGRRTRIFDNIKFEFELDLVLGRETPFKIKDY